MSLSTSSASAGLVPHEATGSRVSLVCAVLVLTALAFIPIGLAWPTVTDSGTVLRVDDIAPVRDSMWLMVMLTAVLGPLNIAAQGIAVVVLVRTRAAGAATWGAALMILGGVMEAVGVANFAAAYFYPSDPAVAHSAAADVYDAIAHDHTHLLVLQLPGHLLLTAGIITQAVALFRGGAVPWWVPTLTLAILLTYAFPGSGALGLVSVVPMTAGCVAVAYFARRTALGLPQT
ncbi:hypothetical protein ACVW00_000212 [Marmoricola sp. URHA0025 HA25]